MLRMCVRPATWCRSAVSQASCSRSSLLTRPFATTAEEPRVRQAVDVSALPKAQRRFVQEMQRVNEHRVNNIHRRNKRSHVLFVAIVALVVGIYFYTIHAVKQETFLQEIDEEMAQEDIKKGALVKNSTDLFIIIIRLLIIVVAVVSLSIAIAESGLLALSLESRLLSAATIVVVVALSSSVTASIAAATTSITAATTTTTTSSSTTTTASAT
uniref:Cytochrome c oxidase assembly factor 3 n=1 Tax=Plectus sambesii TaxID=2011161 RepID=A0A914WTZ8_9BILA